MLQFYPFLKDLSRNHLAASTQKDLGSVRKTSKIKVRKRLSNNDFNKTLFKVHVICVILSSYLNFFCTVKIEKFEIRKKN